MPTRRTAPSRAASRGGLPGGRAAVRLCHAEQLSPEARDALAQAAREHGKAIVLGPVLDTIKLARGGKVVGTLDRDGLRWLLAWAYRPESRPSIDPPPPAWFEGAAGLDEDGRPAALTP